MPIKAIVFTITFAFFALVAQLFGWAALVFLAMHNYWAMVYSGVYMLLASLVGSGLGILAWVSFDSWSEKLKVKGE